MADVQTPRTYNSYIKDLMGRSSDKNKIRFVNKLYGTNFSLDSKVIRLDGETHNQGEERRTDFMMQIEERVFHIEVESDDDDGDMVFRMFEYGYRSAFDRRDKSEKGSLTLRFPDPLLIYLRSSDKTPENFTVNLEFSNNKTFSYEIPIKRLADYTPETLFEGNLYAFALFYPMKYEALLRKKHTIEEERKFFAEVRLILDKIVEEVENNEINSVEYKLIISGFEDVFQRVISKSEILEREEVDGLMENIRTKYAFKELNWMAEGEEKGNVERQRETARRMKADNLPFDAILRYTDLPAEEIYAL
jgi:hypothetical protein